MKSDIKKLDKSIVEITIEENAENISKYRKKVINEIKKNADIKGFRKGSDIPESVIVKNYGEDKIYSMIVDEALNKLYGEALNKHNLLPVSMGEIKEIVSQSPLIVKMHVEVFPEIEIDSKYKKVKVKKTPVSLEKDEVEKTLKEIQNRFTKFIVSGDDYSTKMGDKVYIDTQGNDLSGNKLENTAMQNYPLILGSKVLVPGFEEGLVGKKVGDKFSLDIDFPKDYHNNDFAGKNTKFDVTINKIEKAEIPEFTPEFIKNLRGKDLDLEGFKKLIEEELIETKEANARLEDENKLIDELLKYTKMDIGESLLKNQIEKVFTEIKENIKESGANVSDYITSLGLTEESYKETNVKQIANRRLQAELILHRLSELEKFEITDEEMNKEIEKIMSRYGSKEVIERLKELYKVGTKYYEELKQRINYRKLIDSFFE